jgi:hypothetical protein
MSSQQAVPFMFSTLVAAVVCMAVLIGTEGDDRKVARVSVVAFWVGYAVCMLCIAAAMNWLRH